MEKFKSLLLPYILVAVAMVFFADTPAFAVGNPEFIFLSPFNDTVTVDFYNDSTLDEGVDSIQFFIITAIDPLTTIDSFDIYLKSTPTMKDYEGEVTYILFGLGGAQLAFFGIETATFSTNYSNSIERVLSINSFAGFAVAGTAITHITETDHNVPFTLRVSATEAAK